MNPAWARAIASIESSGAYDKTGPATRKGDRAYGKYQVMGNNVAPWTQEALGQQMTPEAFLNDPDAQEKVFNHRFGGYVDKYGSPQEAASRWFTGRSLAEGANRRDVLGTSGAGYVGKFNDALSAIDAATGATKDTGDNTTTAFASSGTSQPSTVPFAQPFDIGKAVKNMDWGETLQGVGAGLQSIDNPRGAAVTMGLMAQNRKEAQKQQKDGEFAYDAKSGMFYRTRANGMLETSKNPNAKFDDDQPKISEKALQNVGESVEKYGTIAAINREGSDVLDDLHTGKLDLGYFKNWMNTGRNNAGISDDKSRAYARYEQFINKVANDSLLLNKGVQTEGDAHREMKAIAAGGANYDNETAKEALTKLLRRGEEAVTQRGRSMLDAHRTVYGDAPFKPFSDQADRWKSDYEAINRRLEGYARPQQAPVPSSAPAGGFKVIRVY